VKVNSEKDALSKNMKKVIENLQSLMGELEYMSNEHSRGDIDVFAKEDKFQGYYRTVIKGVNEMVKGHEDDMLLAMDRVKHFARGDFDVELKVFPGKKILINENMEGLRGNIKNFIAEMNTMSDLHDVGEIYHFIPEEKFQGAFHTMAKGVNEMVKGHEKSILMALDCVKEFADGNFDKELPIFPGKKVLINENIEGLRKNLKDVNSEVNVLIQFSKEGKLSERANAQKFQGDWAVLIKGLNGLIDALIEPVQEAAAVLEEMSKGNLRVSVKGNYKGDHAKIKDALNDSIETLSSYVTEISRVLNEVADNNLDVGITREYRGNFEEIKLSINKIIHAQNGIMSELKNAADQVASGSRQVSDSSISLSQGATEQASSIEQLTASLEEISSQTQLNAEHAAHANSLVENVKVNAVQGNVQMKEMLQAMAEINDASANISKIIKVIDDIAFQTNILALNAAVEAARAGQHGKGFAVVAEEVRNLAARSANAAKETTDLIEGSIRKVEGGTNIANQTADALNKIVNGVTEVTSLVGEISIASNEQASGISQINQGIMQVSEVVQTISATSEEGASASEELASQAEVLKGHVSKFKLKKTNGMADSFDGFERRNEMVRNDYQYSAYAEAAPARSKKIDLSDNEFGKY
jgi:methyl-accepting chemotaxis protein